MSFSAGTNAELLMAAIGFHSTPTLEGAPSIEVAHL